MYQVYKRGYTEHKELGVCIPYDYTYGSFHTEEKANKEFSKVLDAQLRHNAENGLKPDTRYDFDLVQMTFKGEDEETFIEIGIYQTDQK